MYGVIMTDVGGSTLTADDVSLIDGVDSVNGQQARVSGTCADKPYPTWLEARQASVRPFHSAFDRIDPSQIVDDDVTFSLQDVAHLAFPEATSEIRL